MQLYLQSFFCSIIKVTSIIKLLRVSSLFGHPQATIKLVEIVTLYFQCNWDGLFYKLKHFSTSIHSLFWHLFENITCYGFLCRLPPVVSVFCVLFLCSSYRCRCGVICNMQIIVVIFFLLYTRKRSWPDSATIPEFAYLRVEERENTHIIRYTGRKY
jgi:hypothetical protein